MKYIPKQAMGEGSIFSGHLELAPPTVVARVEMMGLMNMGLEEVMGMKSGEHKVMLSDIGYLAPLIEHSQKFYKAVELKYGEKDLKSFQDLNEEPNCMGILVEVAMLYLKGQSPGKN